MLRVHPNTSTNSASPPKKKPNQAPIQFKASPLTTQDPKWTREVCNHLFNEFEDEFVTLSDHKTAEQLYQYYMKEVVLPADQENKGSYKIQRQSLPLAIVLHTPTEWLGVAVLSEDDMGMLPHLGPWLAFLYVHPLHRGKGVAQKLLDQLCKFTDSVLQIPQLYLWCFTQKLVDFYDKKANFVLHEKIAKHGNREDVFVLRRDMR